MIIELDDSCYTISEEMKEKYKKERMAEWLRDYEFLNASMSYEEMNKRIDIYLEEREAQGCYANLDTKES